MDEDSQPASETDRGRWSAAWTPGFFRRGPCPVSGEVWQLYLDRGLGWLQDVALLALPFSEAHSKGRRLRHGPRASTAHRLSTPHLLRICTTYVYYTCAPWTGRRHWSKASKRPDDGLVDSMPRHEGWMGGCRCRCRCTGRQSGWPRPPPIHLLKSMRPYIKCTIQRYIGGFVSWSAQPVTCKRPVDGK